MYAFAVVPLAKILLIRALFMIIFKNILIIYFVKSDIKLNKK